MGQFTLSSTPSAFNIDVTRLPVKHQIKGSYGLGVLLVIFSSLWGGVPALILIQSIKKGEFQPAMFFLSIFSIIGAVLFLVGLNQFFTKGLLTITSDTVSRSCSSLFGKKKWNEFLHTYEGVLYRSEYHSGGKNASYTLYIVELYHKQKNKTVRLYQSCLQEEIRKRWEDYSRALGLPALEKSEDKIVKRDVGDLDKSIQELVKEKKINVEDVSFENPPEGITVKSEQDMVSITINKKGLPPIAAIFMIFFPAIFIYVGFFVKDTPIMLGVIGVLFEVIMLGIVIWAIIATPQLRITHQDVQLVYLTRWGEIKSSTLPRTSIEQVLIKNSEDNRKINKGVVLQSDSGTIDLGQGLSDDSLHWLKQCVTAALSEKKDQYRF